MTVSLLLLTAPPGGGAAVSAERPAASRPAAADVAILREALGAADRGRWEDARRIASRARDKVAGKLIEWMEIASQANTVPFSDIARFIDNNPDWPAQERLRRRAEEAIDESTPPRLVLAWFGKREPITADGRVALGRALIATGKEKEGREQIRQGWIQGDFNSKQEVRFLKLYGKSLGEKDHRARLDQLLWNGKHDQAERMLRRVDPDYRPVAQARMRLRAMHGGIDSALRRVPQKYAGDAGLAYERLRWRRRKGRDDEAMEVLRNPPKQLVRPDRWWPERALIARRMLAKGHAKNALRAASNHGLTPDDATQYAEAEWMIGWIQLRFLDDRKSALARFERLHDAVPSPAIRARAAYWAGRAAKALGRDEDAQRWYRAAAVHAATYYGQLAAHHASGKNQPTLIAADPIASPAQIDAFENNELVRVANLLHQVGVRRRETDSFMLQIARAVPDPVHKAQAAHLARTMGRTDLAVRVARTAYRENVVLLTDGYPVIQMPDGAPERALLHAITRQESNFDPRAESHAGARGLMQLMPATAKGVAKRIGESYTPARLTTDPAYNIRLGRAYVAMMLDQFNGSYVLALGAYNAGPGNVSKWVRAYGDPRDTKVDVVDWIELIPYTETRNYVQQVLANLQVYRQRLGAAQLASMEQDIRR